jgi:hypothetical protein
MLRLEGTMSIALRDYPALLLIVVVAASCGIVEIGYRLGQRGRRIDEKYHEQFAATRDQAAVLFSLLLGFTLAMSLSRYDLRKQQIVEEADAIGTMQLRGELLPEPARAQARLLFRQYVDARVEFASAGLDETALDRAEAKSAKVQEQLWMLTVGAAEQAPTPITALFVQSLNETIDAADRRLAGLENRIPREIWMMLGMLTVFTSILVGLSLQKRSWSAMLVPPVMFAVVSVLVADLDTPARGLIQTDAQSIERVRTP